MLAWCHTVVGNQGAYRGVQSDHVGADTELVYRDPKTA